MFDLTISYIRWHYTRAVRNLISNEKNFIVFLYNFFSIKLLLQTFFYLWKGLGEKYQNNAVMNFADSFGTFALNMLMRLIGAVIRFFVIIFGVISLVLGGLAAVVIFIAWIFYPLLILVLLFDGFYLIIK